MSNWNKNCKSTHIFTIHYTRSTLFLVSRRNKKGSHTHTQKKRARNERTFLVMLSIVLCMHRALHMFVVNATWCLLPPFYFSTFYIATYTHTLTQSPTLLMKNRESNTLEWLNRKHEKHVIAIHVHWIVAHQKKWKKKRKSSEIGNGEKSDPLNLNNYFNVVCSFVMHCRWFDACMEGIKSHFSLDASHSPS